MPWCPKCKNEYYEGVKVCADCGSELVDSLEEWEKAEREAKEAAMREQMDALKEMLREEADGEAGAEDSAEAEMTLTEGSEDEKDADSGDGDDEAAVKSERKASKTAENTSRGVYQNYEEKAADNKSSAYTLLVVGVIGIIVIVLCFCDVIKLPLSESSRFMILGVMGAMFLFFIVMGAVSMKNAGKYAKKAESEKELTKELEKWFVECVTAEKIDEGLFTEEEADFSEEQKYFKRFDKMKELLSERFLNLNDGYMDRFLDKHYQDIFGDREEGD